MQKVTAPSTGTGRENEDGLFGTSVALGSHGIVALVGGPNAPSSNLIYGPPGPGAAWVFNAYEPPIK